MATLLALAALTGAVWALWIDPSRALLVTVAVLVVSCPCALSLATPAALAAAGASLSRRGLLLTRSHALESLARVTDVVLDKTGTLTEGCFALTRQQTLGPMPAGECLALAAAMEAGSEHPIGRALAGAAGNAGVNAGSLSVANVRNVPGQGVQAEIGGRQFRLGCAAFVAEIRDLGGDALTEVADTTPIPGATQVWLGGKERLLAVFELSDQARESTSPLLEALRRNGARCHLVSGDSVETVQWWAAHFGMTDALGAVSPEGKRDYVAKLQREGAVVLAVGDGINDAPVLAQAQVSIAIGSGAPLAQAGADAVLTHGNVAEIAQALSLARQTRRVVRQNLGWAFFYNVVAIPLAATGFVTAWMAGIGMSVSSLLVVANAWRLLRAGRNGV